MRVRRDECDRTGREPGVVGGRQQRGERCGSRSTRGKHKHQLPSRNGTAHGIHVRELRRRQVQPDGPSRFDAGRVESRQYREQSAVHLWRDRARQDPPHARHRQPDDRAERACERRLPALRAIRRGDGHGASAQPYQRVQEYLPIGRCAAHRRHPVLRRQGTLTGRILPHVQQVDRARADGGADQRSIPEGDSGASRTDSEPDSAAVFPSVSSPRSWKPGPRS